MKENIFYINRMEIAMISKERNVDISVATRMFIHERKLEDYKDALNEWDALCVKYARHKTLTLADLFK